jgi:hypothetical protein
MASAAPTRRPQVTEAILEEASFNRWPSVLVRGFGSNNLRLEPFIVVLPDTANNETMPGFKL